MSRLDDLLELRRQLDVEIQYERETIARERRLRLAVLRVSTRATWNERLVLATSYHFNVDVDLIRGASRHRNIAQARWVAMWLIRDAGRSYPEIGTEIGRDHTTVMTGVRKVNATPALLAAAHAIREGLTGERKAASPKAMPCTSAEVA